MKRLFESLFVVLILVSLMFTITGVTPASAASFMEIVPLSLPTGWVSGYLNEVWGSSASDVYAVGYGNNGGITTPLLYRNNSSGWIGSGLALPTGWTSGYLFSVWGASASEVYAVGSGSVGGTFLPLVYRYDGINWSAFTLSLPPGWTKGYLYGIWGSDANDIYAVGYGNNGSTLLPLIYHYNGSSWTEAGLAEPPAWSSVNLQSIWGSSSSDVTAVGQGNSGSGTNPLLYHYNGNLWGGSGISLPTGWSGGSFYDIWGSSVSDVYTVGHGFNGNTTVPLLYHRNTSNWTETPLTLPTGWNKGYLYGIWGSGATDVYAVGSGNVENKLLPLLYHNAGSGWIEANPSLPTGWSYGYLQGVWGAGAGDVYAVGTGNNGSGNQPLMYHSSQGEQDATPPGNVSNFVATAGTSTGSVSLSWTAPADDAGNNNSGPATTYLVKYSITPFKSWADGMPVNTGIPVPTAPGTTQTMTISGLNPGTLYHFAVRAQDNGYNLSQDYVTASANAKALGAGIYDDTHFNWSYRGSWTNFSGNLPFNNNTLHYTGTVGDTASFAFEGVQFILTYTQNTNRGDIDVHVDGNKVTTINSNGPLIFQMTYTSPVYSFGTHVVQFRNAGSGGGYIDVDAIQILAAPPGAGIYDDTHANWFYTGTWVAHRGSEPFSSNTIHYTGTQGDAASFTFEGIQFVLTYTQNTNRGNIDVYVDGNKVTTINSNGPLAFQSTYTSPMYLFGAHVVQFKNAGGGGGYIDVDAIQVIASPPGTGIYDDTHANWSYTGSWTSFSGSLPFASNTMHYTGALGDTAAFAFEGIQFVLTYTQNTNRGNMDIYVDSNKVTTINANGPLVFQKTYVSPVYSFGTHVVQFRNAGGGGGYVDVDAIQILATPAGAGIYDDTNSNWVYSGNWTPHKGSEPFSGNTIHYTGTLGDAASFAFEGIQFILFYTQNTNRGNMDVYVDGNQVGTINANGPLVFQSTYTSALYPAGVHVVELRNAGGGGGYIDVDAIQVIAAPAGAGTYDDVSSNWIYSGNWTVYSGSLEFANNTMHYTSTLGDSASFTFAGTQFIFTYTQNTNRGDIDVFVDGTKVTTIHANGSLVFQSTYTSPTYSSGTHVVQFRNAGGGGGYIDVDAIQVIP